MPSLRAMQRLIGGMTLHEGRVRRDALPGEGKTLVAGTLAVCRLERAVRQGCAWIAVNDYLARRDASFGCARCSRFLGLSVGVVIPFEPPPEDEA